MADKKIEAADVFWLITDGTWDVDQFMHWYFASRDAAYSQGYKEASENAYKTGGGFEF